jgi:hypothetical protein
LQIKESFFTDLEGMQAQSTIERQMLGVSLKESGRPIVGLTEVKEETSDLLESMGRGDGITENNSDIASEAIADQTLKVRVQVAQILGSESKKGQSLRTVASDEGAGALL